MNFFKVSQLLLASTLLFACASTENIDSKIKESNVAKATNLESEQVVVSKEARDLARTDISSKKLGEKLVCTVERKTGTKFKTKVCRTKRQVEEERQRSREELERLQRGAPGSSD